jgi:ABC-type multidrug transport system fused ATPase/permease subunit
MAMPAERVLALAPRLFAAAAVPILGLWGLTAKGREKSAEEKREEAQERTRRARMLVEMCDSLAASKFDVTDVEKENQIEWEDVHRRATELAVMDPEAPELEEGLVWCAKVLLQQLRLTTEKTRLQKDVRYADCNKLDDLWWCEEQLHDLTRLISRFKVPADLMAEIKAAAKKAYRLSRTNQFKDVKKAAAMILLAKRAMPWLLADMAVSAYTSYWRSMSIYYRTEVMRAIQTTRSATSPAFVVAVKAMAIVELFTAVLGTLNSQLATRSQDLVARDIQGQLYAAIFAKDENWWSHQTGNSWKLIQLVFFLPQDLKRFMKIPKNLITAIVQIVVQCRLVAQHSSRILYILLALHWGNFFAQMGFDWANHRTGRRLTAKLVEPSQEKFTWIHALKPEFAHMFQSFARGEKERKGIEDYLEMSNRRTELTNVARQIFQPAKVAVEQVADIASYVSTGGLMESGGLQDAFQAQQMMTYANGVGDQMESSYRQLRGFSSGLKPLADAFGHISIPPKVDLNKGIIPKDENGNIIAAKGDIELVNVCFTYPRNSDPTLNGATFKVNRGEFCGLTGETGSGKSTVLQLIERFYDLDQEKNEDGTSIEDSAKGVIKLDGRDIREYNPRWLRSQIGVVSQSAQLLPVTVRDNLMLACQQEPTFDEIKAACIAADIWDSINNPAVFPNGLETKMTTTVSIAGGEKQRICIARAILADSPILFLDEATSALDESTQAKVQGALDKLMEGRTTIAIAHRLSTIKSADRIIALRGKKSEQRYKQEKDALEYMKESKADVSAAIAWLKSRQEEDKENKSSSSDELATTETLLQQAVESGEPGGGLSGTVGCNGKHDELLAKPVGSVYKSLWEEHTNQQAEDIAPGPKLQRQTTTTAGKFEVLRGAINSLKGPKQQKHAVMKIIAKLEADSHEMEEALSDSTLDASLSTANAVSAQEPSGDGGDGGEAAAALVRTLTAGSRSSSAATKAARRRWHIAAMAATTSPKSSPKDKLTRTHTVG